jgi:hypothetical protein
MAAFACELFGLNLVSPVVSEFAKVCEQSTDFHFPDLEQQFQRIEQNVMKGNEWRMQQKLLEEGDKISIKSSGSSGSQVHIKIIIFR